MAAAGAAHELRDDADDLGLPVAGPVAGPVLVDPAGGVVDVDAVRALLVATAGHTIVRAEVDGIALTTADTGGGGRAEVRVDGATHRFDAVVLAAGAGTAALAADVGVDLPSALQHHARFTFALPDGRGPRGSTRRPPGCAPTSTAAGRGGGRSAARWTPRPWRGRSGRRRRPGRRARRCSGSRGSG
jgi:glycine/D-amino acid oxidase-like deaminating enzyme